MQLRILRWFLLSGAVPSAAPAAQSDAVTITLNKPSCTTCRIERRVVVEFGKDPAAQEAAPDGLMGAIAVGNVFLGIVRAMKATPVVFGADGKLIRSLGRYGQGPGEFSGPGFVSTWRGDSILIGDPGAGRIAVYDRSWRFGRTFPMSPMVETWAVLDNGTLVVGVSPAPGSRDVLRILDASGKQLATFGQMTPRDSVAGGMLGPPLVSSDGRTIWTVAWLGAYRISEWNPRTRQRVRILVRKGEDFAEEVVHRDFAPTVRPSSYVRGFYRDGRILWVLYGVADRRWAQGLVQAEMQGHTGKQKYWKPDKPDLVYDTIVEAIDIATSTLLASRKFDEADIALISSGSLAVQKVESADGESLSRLVRFELKR